MQGTQTGRAKLSARLAQQGEHAACFAVRERVFVAEQGVPAELEADGHDAGADHFVLYRADRLVGTARLRECGGLAKAERVAVLHPLRGSGGGRLLMAAVEARARRLGFEAITLHAQASVIPFYASLGYVAQGGRFVEAGIEHLRMTKPLT